MSIVLYGTRNDDWRFKPGVAYYVKGTKMRILAIYRYFWPDNAPYGRILKIILSHLAKNGHECSVITGYPSYNYIQNNRLPKTEHIDNIRVKRFFTCVSLWRGFDFFIFFVKAFFYVIRYKNNYDLMIVNSYPPVAMGFFARFISKITGLKYIYHLQDIQPESLRYAGKIKLNPTYELLRHLDKENCEKALKCVTLSEDMKNTLIARGIQDVTVQVINNPAQKEPTWKSLDLIPDEFPKDKFIILFAGNMGRFQCLHLFIDAAKILSNHQDIVFVFMGDGAMRQKLFNQAGQLVGKNVIFIPYQKPEVAGSAMQFAELGLVPLMPGLANVAYPSKVPTLLNYGCPVLALVESESELAKTINNNRLGYILPNRDPEQIALCIEKIREDYKSFKEGKDAYFFKNVEKLFGYDSIMKRWDNLLTEIEESGKAC